MNISNETLDKIQKSLVHFRYVALSNDEENELAPAYFHHDLSNLLLNSKDNVAVEMFRESGKSSFALRTYPLHALCYPDTKRDYIVIIKQTQRQASAKLKELIDEYKSNPLVTHNMVSIREENAQCFSVDVLNEAGDTVNVRIEAYGKGGSIRGLSNQDRRPKIIILDDVQDKEDARSETVVETDWDWFLSDILFLGKKARLFLIGNNLGERCIIERVINNKENLGFYGLRVPVMIDGVPTWAEKQNLQEIERERASYADMGKLDIWYAEKMCQAVSEETRVFKEEDYRYYSPHRMADLKKTCNVYACLDPASSTRADSCLRAIAIVAVNSENYWFILDMKYGRWDSAEGLEIIFDTVREYNLRDFGIEKGHFQQVLEPFLMKEMANRNEFFNVIPLEHAKQGSKLDRIKMLQPRFKAHTVWFPDTAPWLAELKTELAGVTKDAIKSEYIDCVDALAMIEQVGKPPLNQKKADEYMNRMPRTYYRGNASLFKR